MNDPKIIYTLTDEAPALATYSLLPIVKAFTTPAGIAVETRDISLAGRILANFPESLKPEQRQPDDLTELGELAKTPAANIIKLPNISASTPQLKAAVEEMQSQGYALPDYPDDPKTESEKAIRAKYGKVLGSAVNPVLREGNSDRRVSPSVKQYAKNHPHSMGDWTAESKSHVAHMSEGDFYGSEKSVVVKKAGQVRIEFKDKNGATSALKTISVQEGEVVDASLMSCGKLREFLEKEIADAKAQDVLFSLHVKATMMKVSDPILFGHAVTVYYNDIFKKHADLFAKLGVEPNDGIGDVYARIQDLPAEERARVEADLQEVYRNRPALAMVDSAKGITNLHVPSNVIIDASMPAAIRASGKMWGPDGKLHDMKAVIPDRCYAGIYQEAIDDCRKNGAFDVRTMGNVANVGLMAQAAEEYGSHDKTFEIAGDGTVRVVDAGSGEVLMEHPVEKGDVWRACQTKDLPIRDWVKLAVDRARATRAATIFWLDEDRAHDRNLIEKVRVYLKDHDTSGLDIRILAPTAAIRESMKLIRAGKDSVSVTGNVLRDYLTDLFPILELGTSAKMLSIVPLLAGGGLYETGAGGSAPKHVQQMLEEGHLRWDSLGEYLALAVSIEDMARKTGNARGLVLADALDRANGKILENGKSPSAKVRELDTRGSHFYLALYWAQALAEQTQDKSLQTTFAGVAKQLEAAEAKIVEELTAAQGRKVDIGGYYHPDVKKTSEAMRPSATLNAIVDGVGR